MKKFLRFKKATALALSILMVFTLLIGCSPKEDKPDGVNDEQLTAGEPKYQEKIIIGNATVFTNNDPQATNTLVNWLVNKMTHDTLFVYNWERQETLGSLAKKYEMLNDKTYKLYLEEGVKFHNGAEFKSNDVKFTFERALESSFQEPFAKQIKSMEVIDDYTIIIELNDVTPDFIDNLTLPQLSILSEQAFTDEGEVGTEETPIAPGIGTGPYILDEWVAKEYCILKANEDYYEGAPKTKEIEFRQFTEPSAAIIAVQTGDIDVLIDPNQVEADNLAADENINLMMAPSTQLMYIAISMNGAGGRTLLKDNAELRKAIAMSINQEELIEVAYDGKATVAKNLIPVTVPGHLDDLSAYSYNYNPEEAKKILKEQGYEDGLTIDLTYSTANSRFFEILEAQFREVGIKLNPYATESAVYTETMRAGDYDLIIQQWNYGIPLASDLNNLWSSGSGSNKMRSKDENIDRMLKAGSTEADTEKRQQIYRELQEYLIEYCAIIPLLVPTKFIATQKNVEGIVFRADSRYEFRNMYKIIN